MNNLVDLERPRQARGTDPEAAATVVHPHEQMAGEYLSFQLGGQEYGLEILKVQELRSFEQPTRIAGSSAMVLGVINLRGIIVPVIDMGAMMGMPPMTKSSALTVTILLKIDCYSLGAVVDAVNDVVDIKQHELRPVPNIRARSGTLGIQAMACVGEEGSHNQRLIALLDAHALIASAGIANLDLSSP